VKNVILVTLAVLAAIMARSWWVERRRRIAAEARLAVAESERLELTGRLAEVEHQVGRLMTLYVATYQLHATLDPAEVQSTIAEIVLNLIGAEQFVLLLIDDDAPVVQQPRRVAQPRDAAHQAQLCRGELRRFRRAPRA